MSTGTASWVVLARCASAPQAEMLAAQLRERGIAAHVEHADPLTLAIGGAVRVVVPASEERRARFDIGSNADLTDAEAWYLATGELDPAAASAAFAQVPGASARRAQRHSGRLPRSQWESRSR